MVESGLGAVGDVVAVLDAAVRNHVADVAADIGWTSADEAQTAAASK